MWLIILLFLFCLLPIIFIILNLKFLISLNEVKELPEPKASKELVTLATISGFSVIGLFLLTPLSPFYYEAGNEYSYFGFGNSMSMWRIGIRLGLLFVIFLCARRAMKMRAQYLFSISHKKIFLISQFLGLAAYVYALLNGLSNMNFGWGRPLRINGREIEPQLNHGSNWATRPIKADLDIDQATRSALEALWLRDAKKEFASIPAFNKLSWYLAGLGAGPELLKSVQLAATQEIEHAQLCFSMASNFGNTKWSASSVPEIFKEKDTTIDVDQLALECLVDGCLMESFNADVARESLEIVKDEESKKILSIITRDETYHGKLSWSILSFLYSKGSKGLKEKLKKEMTKISSHSCPMAYPKDISKVVEAGDPQMMLYFGRLPKEKFPALWVKRIEVSQKLLNNLLKLEPESETPILF